MQGRQGVDLQARRGFHSQTRAIAFAASQVDTQRCTQLACAVPQQGGIVSASGCHVCPGDGPEHPAHPTRDLTLDHAPRP